MEYQGILISLCVAWILHVSGWPCHEDRVGIHRFGEDCSLICHCRNNQKCDQDGTCTNGCAQRMFGPSCQYVDIAHDNPSSARHLNNLIHPRMPQYAKLAVDSDPNTCSYTKQAVFQDQHPWWRQWFPYNVIFKYIEFHVHADYAANMSLYRVSVANVSNVADVDNWPRDTLCYETQSGNPPISPTSADRSVLSVLCKQPVVGNTIRIELQRNHTQLVLCDVYISEVCRHGYWGPKCANHCTGCKNANCQETNGTCIDGCKSGYKPTTMCNQKCEQGSWGQNCSLSCRGCEDGKCNPTSGICNTRCNPGYIPSNMCNEECKQGSWGQNCSLSCHGCEDGKCNPTSGICNNRCNPGYIPSDMCNEECEFWRFGRHCAHTCNSHCSDRCHHVTGHCSCNPGYKPPDCNNRCDILWFGENCTQTCSNHCSDGCDHVTGHCFCESGYKAPDCKTKCDSGMFGVNCSQTCSNHCNDTCDHVTGHCTCHPGYKSPACNTKCDSGMFGVNCSQTCSYHCNDTCDHVTGHCTCHPGYKAPACSTKCDSGMFGVSCSQTCSNHCNDTCDHVTGHCTCHPGYKSPACNTQCDSGMFGVKCSQTCSNHCNDTCDHVTGHCTCYPGYKAPACNTNCDPGLFGVSCSQTCSSHCNDTCDHVTGHCTCNPGYKAPKCIEECQEGTYGKNCNQTCGNCQNAPCDVVSGRCESCLDGYAGYSCDTRAEDSSQFPLAIVSGGSTVALFLLVAMIIIATLLIRMNKAKRNHADLNEVTTVRQPTRIDGDKHLQRAAEELETVSEQNSSPPSSVADIREQVYSLPVESSVTTIALTQFHGYVMSKSADEHYFASEFKKIPYGLQYATTIATAPVNVNKNRYKDMLAYDHSRVVLNTVDGKEGSNYINACFIEGFNKKRAYIASQGPTVSMMDDYWRMVWEKDVCTVVMVTNLVELGKMKCLRYWPLEVGSKGDFQALTTTLIFTEEFTDYTVRKITLSHKDKPSASRVVTHFHYTAWPDKDVPASPSGLLHFWRRVRAHDPDKQQPWVVHCSAGVGRTGTFIAMDILIDEGQARQTVDVYACVTKLRQQRVNMVQTAGQYKYLHRLMVEYLTLSSQFVSNDAFANYQNTLLLVDKKLNKTGLLLQYETEASYHKLELAGASIKGDEGDPYSVATIPENAKKNRFDAILPNNRYRAMLTVPVDGRNDYINAVYMSSYKVDNKYILTQKPLSDTVVDCWRLIESRDIGLVVTFPDEGNEQNGQMFPATGSLNVGPFNIMFITEHHEEDYLVSRVFKVQYMKKERTVTQLLYQKWPRRQMAPPNVGEFLMLMDAVEKRTKSSTALIQCLDGATRSGLLLILLYATECLTKDGEVSLPMVIRHLRTRRPQLIPNIEQYRFCYSLLTQYVESSVTYANA